MNSSMNLLSEARQEKHRTRRVRRKWRPVCLIAFLALACWSWLEYRSFRALAAERDSLERQFAPLKSAKANIKRISKTCDQLRTKEQFAIDLTNALPAVTFCQAIENAAFECSGELYVKELVYVRQSGRTVGPSPTDRPSSLTIRGLGENNLAIAKFAAALRDSRLFSNVELAASESQEVDGKAVQEFELNGTLVAAGVHK